MMAVHFPLTRESFRIESVGNMNRKGFTLIELLIVVAIIGILAAIAVPNFLNAQIRAKVTRTWSDMKAVVLAFEMYKMDNGVYVPDYDGLGMSNYGSELKTYKSITTPIAYMSSIPTDAWIPQKFEAQSILGKNERYWEYWGAHIKAQEDIMRPYGMGYVMRSVGVDKDGDWGGDYVAIGKHTGRYSYNTSNGLISSGDFLASNRGLE